MANPLGETPKPAPPGTYGLAPGGFRLPEATRLGPVRLQVGDLERSLAFYVEVLGMHLLERQTSRARLGSRQASPDSLVVELYERAGARPVRPRSRVGLFHFAILLPNRASLGRFLIQSREHGLQVGAGDHAVSQSLYLSDPDGLGIEVYADRPRESWRRVGRELVMGTDPLDLQSLVEAASGEPWDKIPSGTVLGHVHLHVGDLATAARFYSEAVGFDRTVWSYPGALFLAAGGYHHHLGANVWAEKDAPPPAPDEAQLLDWTIELPDPESLAAVAKSLEHAGYIPQRDTDAGGGEELRTKDPWGTHLRLRVAAEGSGNRSSS